MKAPDAWIRESKFGVWMSADGGELTSHATQDTPVYSLEHATEALQEEFGENASLNDIADYFNRVAPPPVGAVVKTFTGVYEVHVDGMLSLRTGIFYEWSRYPWNPKKVLAVYWPEDEEDNS